MSIGWPMMTLNTENLGHQKIINNHQKQLFSQVNQEQAKQNLNKTL